MKRNLIIRFSALALLLGEPLLANAGDLPEVVVTADRIGTSEEQTTADVTVITKEEIEKSGQATVADVLRRHAGIDVAQSGGPGKQTSVFIRGANSGHTLVLVDGVRMGSATTGAFDWANLSTANVERIEIVRGPQSGLYGSDAIGGVIQIFTRKGGETPEARVQLEAGGLGTTRVGVSATGGRHGVRYGVTAGAYRTRGVSAAANGTEPDSYHATNWSANLEMPVGEGMARFSGLSSDGTTGLDGYDPVTFAFGDILNYQQRLQQRALRAELEYPMLDNWSTLFRLARSEDVLENIDPVNAGNNANIRTRIDQWSWENRLDFGLWNVLVGLEQHRDYGKNPDKNLDKRIDQTAGFAELGVHESMVDATAAIRHDRNSTVENKTTWRLGLGVRPIAGLKLSANYGTGFKAPSINDLYYPLDAWGYFGNPNLKPESSKGWDVGVQWVNDTNIGEIECRVTYFRQEIRNLISWANWPQPQNINQSRISGWELEGRYAFGAGYVRANWTVQDAKDVKKATWLSRRAHEKGGIALGIDGGSWGVDGFLAIVGPRFSSAGNKKRMAGYTKLDARAWFDINKHLRLIGRVDNAGNKHYEEVSGYGVMPRVWYVGVSARL